LVDVCLSILSGLSVRLDHLRNFLWLLNNLCRGTHFLNFAKVEACAPFFAQIASKTDDPDCLAAALWGLSDLTNSLNATQIAAVYRNTEADIVLHHAKNSDKKIEEPAWRFLGNLVTTQSYIVRVILTKSQSFYVHRPSCQKDWLSYCTTIYSQ
jgi:hypothetical protein